MVLTQQVKTCMRRETDCVSAVECRLTTAHWLGSAESVAVRDEQCRWADGLRPEPERSEFATGWEGDFGSGLRAGVSNSFTGASSALRLPSKGRM